MGRRFVALALSVAVQLAMVYAPLVHAHPDDHDTDHHRAHAVHAHFAVHAGSPLPAGHLALDDTDHDRAVFLQLFVAAASSSFALALVTQSFVELPAPAEAPAHRTIHVVRGHDPPILASLPPRAPPSFLS